MSPDPETAQRREAGPHEVLLVVAGVAMLFFVGHFHGSLNLDALTSSRWGFLPVIAIGCLIYEYTMREARRSDAENARSERR